MKKTVIELKDVHKSYYLSSGEEIPVLKGIDLKIYQNEFVALMGESGGGKSTLLNIIGCLHSLTSGEYFINNENIEHLNSDDELAHIRSKKIGFIFQSFNLLARFSALENVSLPSLYANIPEDERMARAKKLLNDVGVGDRIDHKPSELSGGQQQRVAIARSLSNNPDILLADEPTGALDSISGEEIMKIFMNLKKQDKTIVMVTHTPEVAKYADRIIFLKDGKVVDNNYKLK
jgi:putative ABC transport system ATP-binding protein